MTREQIPFYKEQKFLLPIKSEDTAHIGAIFIAYA